MVVVRCLLLADRFVCKVLRFMCNVCSLFVFVVCCDYLLTCFVFRLTHDAIRQMARRLAGCVSRDIGDDA